MRESNPANGAEGRTDWNAINWRQANRNVRNLRQRIYRASKEGDLKKVRSLQKLMLRSYSNSVLSVRRVTQDNQGKYTAGVDREIATTPKAKGRMVDWLIASEPWKAKPARRVYIPKPNTHKLRPLGIPAIRDRCLQAKVKNALEPEWEARFEVSSYGFRLGRSPHDAICAIYHLANSKRRKRWVLDADIESAYDNINHESLLKAIGTFPARELVKQWLKAGFMEKGVHHDTPTGTPQGGVASPLLFNIALHGMEEALGVRRNKRGHISKSRYGLVKFADDFVVFCETKEDAEAAKYILNAWLAERGLKLSEEKTCIRHLLEGFDFLGVTVRLYSVSNTRTGLKLLITPSKASLHKIRKRLREVFAAHRGANVRTLITQLQPIIKGWARYFRPFVSSKAFQSLDRWLFAKQVRWAKRKHPNKSWRWIKGRYFRRHNPSRQDRWVFGDLESTVYLDKFSWHKIKRHVMVKGTASVDDASLKAYWAKRSVKLSGLSPLRHKLAHTQQFKCPACGLSLFNGEMLERHHLILDKTNPKRHALKNQRLLHRHCHQYAVHGALGNRIPKVAKELILDA